MRFEIRTTRREELIDVSLMVEEAVAASGVAAGIALVFCPHTTAAVTINEDADPNVLRDLVMGLARISPRDGDWLHSEGNSDGHLKSSLVGPSVVVPVENGRPVLGTWQGIYFCEFDGPRNRGLDITVVPGVR